MKDDFGLSFRNVQEREGLISQENFQSHLDTSNWVNFRSVSGPLRRVCLFGCIGKKSFLGY